MYFLHILILYTGKTSSIKYVPVSHIQMCWRCFLFSFFFIPHLASCHSSVFWQWTSGQWAASWLNCSQDEHFSLVQTVSFHACGLLLLLAKKYFFILESTCRYHTDLQKVFSFLFALRRIDIASWLLHGAVDYPFLYAVGYYTLGILCVLDRFTDVNTD